MIKYKIIPDYPNYQAGTDGSIWSKSSGEWRKLSIWISSTGYYHVNLHKNGLLKKFVVSRLILITFVGPCPDGKECAHNNGISTDNRLENLRWATPKENVADQKLHGTAYSPCGEQSGNSKLTNEQIIDIRSKKLLQKEYAKKYNTIQQNISNIQCGYSWKHLL